MTATLTEARRRHPCMRPPLAAATVRDRVSDELELHGAPHPEVGAAILAVRGASGLDQVAFAAHTGVDPQVIVRAEAGELSRERLPGALRRMVPA